MFSHYLRSALGIAFLFLSAVVPQSAQADIVCPYGCDSVYSSSQQGRSQVFNGSYNRIICNYVQGGIEFTAGQVQCSGDGSCPEGENLDMNTGVCTDDGCPDGMVKTGGICLPSTEPDVCEDVAGYLSGVEICNDDINDCAAEGGQYGELNGQIVCVPNDYGAPECEGGGGLVMVESGFVCESPTDNSNGTDNESTGPNNDGGDPDTDVQPDNPDDPTDVDPTTITDTTELEQESLAESQEQSKQLRKMTNQLGDINDELNKLTSEAVQAEDRENARDEARTMRDHTVQSVATYQDALNNFYNAIGSAPATQAFQNMSNIVPTTGGQCPPFAIDLTDTMIGTIASTDIHCDLLEDMAPAINAIMLVVFAWTAFRVFASS